MEDWTDGQIYRTPDISDLIEAGGRKELVMSFPMEMRSYDPATGDELWRCGGLNPLVYTSPVHDDGIIVAMGGYHGNSIGVKAGGKGDVTKSRLWQEVRHMGGIGTGVTKDGYLYVQNSSGIAYCIEMETGTTVWEERLPGKGKSWGSFVLSGDLVRRGRWSTASATLAAGTAVWTGVKVVGKATKNAARNLPPSSTGPTIKK